MAGTRRRRPAGGPPRPRPRPPGPRSSHQDRRKRPSGWPRTPTRCVGTRLTSSNGNRDGRQDGDERGFGRPASKQPDEYRGSQASREADRSPEQAEHDGLDEELLEDIAGPRTRRPRHYCSCRKRWVNIPTCRVIRLPHRRLSGHCGSSFGTFSRVFANGAPTPSAALIRGQTSLPSGLSVVCGRGKAPSKISGTLVALAAHDKMSVPLELSDLSRNQLWRQIRGFSRSPLGKASTKGKLRSDPFAPAHRHKLVVFPHKDGNRGQREGDDGRDTNTTNAGPGQADLVHPLATATVCSVSGLRIGTVLGGEPHGPGSPWIVKMMTATEDTEIRSLKAPDLKGLSLNLSNSCSIPSMTRQRGSIVMLGPHFPAS